MFGTNNNSKVPQTNQRIADGSNGTSSPPPSADSRFSLVELRKIHLQLVENKIVDDENKNLVVEILRVIAEMVVYGDNKSELLFDFFCEKNMLQLFLDIMWTEKGCPTSVHIQILQTLSILISCVKNDTSLYYLLSNNYINDIITFPHDFAADESLLAQFASFMKSLSLRLNVQTVQFFFIEDTGAFPLLTKAVELLSCKDPMIRISAQATILNVYQVDEPRSRAYALQDDVMNILFDGIVQIMKEQYQAVCKYGVEFIKIGNEQELDMGRLKQNFEDVGINLEDWLFYVQDLMDLKILVLQKAMSSYLLNNFICPVLLEAFLSCQGNQNVDLNPTKLMSLEIDVLCSDEDNKKSRNPNVWKEDPSEHQLAIVGAALYYLLHIIRILSSPIMRHGLLLTLCHPMAATGRFVGLQRLSRRENIDSSTKLMNGDENMFNPYKIAIEKLLSCHNQVVENHDAMILGSKVHFLEAIFAIPALGFSETNESIDWSMINFPQSVSPSASSECLVLDDEETWKKKRHGLHIKKLTLCGHFNPDYLPANMLLSLNKAVFENIEHCPESYVARLCQMLAAPHKYSLTIIQVVVQLIHSVGKLLFEYSKSIVAPPNDTFGGYGTFALHQILDNVREASRVAAEALLARFDSHFSEMLLILINEEIKRFQGRKWKVIFPRMLSEKLLMVPNCTKYRIRFGIDFEVPISQVETVRREVQHFLLFRILLKQLMNYTIYKHETEIPNFDLSTLINDKDFLSVEESNLVPDHLVEGCSFDMKGKKFLDTSIFSDDEERHGIPSALPGTVQATPGSWSASMLGLIGNSRKQINSTGRVTGDKTSNKDRDKFLFVQDPNLLLIILQRRIDGKSVFKIHTVAPLIYTDAKIDLANKHKFSIMVRSWKGITNLKKLDMESPEDGIEDDSTKFTAKKFESYLKQPERSSIYQISLIMDTEQASALAVQHIESRRKALNAIKMEKLKNLLIKWISGNEIGETD